MSAHAPSAAAGASGSDSAASASGSKRALAGAAADERRGQPQPPRRPDGLRSAAHLDGRSAAALPQPLADSHADAPAQPPPADRLYRHALESIFAFLGLRDLADALRVSRGWLGAVQSMRRLELSARPLGEDQRLGEVAQSPLARHVAELRYAHLDADALAVLADRMAHLRELGCALSLPPPDQPLAFPSNLRRLEIHLVGPADEAQVDAVLVAVGRLPLLQDLILCLAAPHPLISFAPLAELPLLRRIDFWRQSSATDLSDAQVDQLRALPRLQRIDVPMSTELLGQLLRRPHDLQWQQISLPLMLDDEAAALLAQLPTLTAISGHMQCERFGWLRGLPNLTDINMSLFTGEAAAGHTESLIDGLQSCTKIEILELDGCHDLTAAHLAELLPRLRELRLISLEIDSLAFLSQPPLTSQLSRLGLDDCPALPLAELRHVRSLRGLAQLILHKSFVAPLDEESRSQWTPPSVLLPRLVEFEYRAR